MKRHILRFMIWLMITIIVGIFFGFAYFYSRDMTLNNVRMIDFKIISKALAINTNKNVDNFKPITNALLTKKKYPLFQLALISNDTCIENVTPYYEKRFGLSICKIFQNSNILYKEILTNKHRKYFDEDIFQYNDENFVYKKINNEKNIWLVGRLKDYDIHYGTARFFEYIKRDGLNWLFTMNGIKKFYKETESMWHVLFLVSLLLYIIYTATIIYHKREFMKKTKEKKQIEKEWEKINEELHSLFASQYQTEVYLSEKRLSNSFDAKNIKLLQDKIDSYQKRIANLNKKIIQLEKRERAIQSDINKKLHKLTMHEREKELVKSQDKLNNLELLWRYEPSWIDRRNIEKLVALKKNHLPFVTTQMFILFEKIINKMVIKIKPDYENENLFEKIKILFDYGRIPIHYEKKFHKARKARNNWFHKGQYPNNGIIDFLIDILHKTDEEPII